MALVCVSVWLAMAVAAFSYHRLGPRSRSYQALNRFETFAVQGALLFLIYRSERADSFVCIVYFIHLVATVPLGLALDLKLMCATPLVVAVLFHLGAGTDAAADFSVGAAMLGFFVVTMMLQSQTALARAEAGRQSVLEAWRISASSRSVAASRATFTRGLGRRPSSSKRFATPPATVTLMPSR